jgi:hypothetical protein
VQMVLIRINTTINPIAISMLVDSNMVYGFKNYGNFKE